MTNFRECDILNALRTAKDERNDLVLWSENFKKGTRVLARVLSFTKNTVKLIVKRKACDVSLERMFIHSKLGVYSQRSNFKFKSVVVDFYKNRLTISFPENVEFLYKRKHDRVEAPNGFYVGCSEEQVLDKTLQLPVYDISRGGISLLLDQGQLEHFSLDEIEKELDLLNQDTVEGLKARIVNVRDYEGNRHGKSHRVSLEFCEMSESNEQLVEQLVNRFDNRV